MSAPSPLNTEPVAVAEGVRVVLLGVVALGWVTLDDARVTAVSLAVAALVSGGMTLWARLRVTSLARPRDAAGRMLEVVDQAHVPHEPRRPQWVDPQQPGA